MGTKYAVINAKTRLVLGGSDTMDDAREIARNLAVETNASTMIVDTTRQIVRKPVVAPKTVEGKWEVTAKYGKTVGKEARMNVLYVGDHDQAVAILKANPGSTMRRHQGKYEQGQHPLRAVLYSK